MFLQPVNFIATVALDVSVKMIDEGLDRAGVGDVTLPANEDRKAEALGSDDWPDVVYDCATQPLPHSVRAPALLGWVLLQILQQYRLSAAPIPAAAS